MEVKNQNQLKKKRPRQKVLMKCRNNYRLNKIKMIQDVYNNLNNDKFKTTVDK